jgi:hypothetical protein
MTYGCYNRPPLAETVVVQDGWVPRQNTPPQATWFTREPVLRRIVNPNSKECNYSQETYDPGCTGCKHNVTNLQSKQ